MQPSTRASTRLWLLPAAVAVVQLARLTATLQWPDGHLVDAMNDDAFYYLQLARNFAVLGRWTFDRVEPASGFHLLWAYLLAAIYRVHPSIGPHGIFAIAGSMQIVFLTCAAAIAVRTAVRLFGHGAELGVAVIFLSTLSLYVGGLLMEAPLVILVSAAVLDLLSRTQLPSGPRPLLLALLLGLCGTLARTDFGLLPLVLFFMQLFLWRRRRSSAAILAASAAVLAGSLLGIAVVAVHTHWISGVWLQSSARQKLFWSQIEGYSIAPVCRLLLEYVDSTNFAPWNLPRASHLLSKLAAACAFAALALRCRRDLASSNTTIVAGLGAVVAAYLGLYRYNSAQLGWWYLANFQAALALLVAAAFAFAVRLLPRTTLAVALALCLWGVAGAWQPDTQVAAPLYAAGVFLREHPELKPAGAWNAGAVAYFANGGVTNLDGLVNDRIYPYARAGTLAQYIKQRNLHSIADFSALIQPAPEALSRQILHSRRTGYFNSPLQNCLQRDPAFRNAEVAIYRVLPGCL